MRCFIEDCRSQSVLLPKRLDDSIAEDNPVRAIDAFVGELDLRARPRGRPLTTLSCQWRPAALGHAALVAPPPSAKAHRQTLSRVNM